MSDPLATVRRRLFQQRLAGEPFERPEEAVRWLGAVQAQEFAEAKWLLAQRTRDRSAADVEAAFDRGEILRTHVLRPTWHFVARALGAAPHPPAHPRPEPLLVREVRG